MTDTPTAATVYVPREGSLLGQQLPPKTAIVGSNAEDWLARKHAEPVVAAAPTSLTIDYEKPGPSANIVTFADRVYHAFDRHTTHYPTHKRMVVAPDQLWPVAFYWAPEGRVEISGSGAGLQSVLPDGQALYKLAEWLGMTHDPFTPGIGDNLARELRVTHRVNARATGGRLGPDA
jgi:hypothetical protein